MAGDAKLLGLGQFIGGGCDVDLTEQPMNQQQ